MCGAICTMVAPTTTNDSHKEPEQRKNNEEGPIPTQQQSKTEALKSPDQSNISRPHRPTPYFIIYLGP
eukprot:g54778.t1